MRTFRVLATGVFVFLAGAIAQAQVTATISGRVLAQDTDGPLPYATVVLEVLPDSQLVTGAISDDDGRFSLAGIASGDYLVTVSFVGYQDVLLPVFVGEVNTVFDIGTLLMVRESAQLDEVLVEAQRAIVSSGLDSKSFDIDDNIAQSGGTVLDAMKGLPGVTVDQEGKVLLRGSDKVAILIDDRQSSLTGIGSQKGLDNIPAANIERIEIINNPSARYDAAGMAGIINIIYKKEEEYGLNAEVGLSLAMGVLSPQKEDLPTDLGSYDANPKYIPSVNLNYRAPEVYLFLRSEILQQKSLPNNEFTERIYDDGRRTLSQVPENRTQTHYILQSGADWFVTDKDVVRLSGTWDFEHHIDTAQVAYIDDIQKKRLRYWAWSEDEVTGFASASLDYEHDFPQAGHGLKARLQYTRGWEDEQYFLNDSSAVRNSVDTTHIDATENLTSFVLDYVRPLRSGRLESGTSLQVRTIPVTYIVGPGERSTIYPSLGEWSDWGENIFAGYLNYVYERRKFHIEAGLRAEYAEVSYDLAPENIYYPTSDAYDYFEIYPSTRLTARLDERNSLSAFYNRRVDRPGEPELRVFPKYDDPELLKVGNPYLRPQYTQTFEVAYRHIWNSGSLFISGFHRVIDDPFQRIYAIDTTSAGGSTINKIYQNTGSGSNSGTELLLSQDISDNWEVSATLDWYTNIVDAHEGSLLFPYGRPFRIERTKDNTWDLKMNSRLSLPGKVQVQFTLVYLAPKNIPQGRQLARSSVDIGIRKAILGDRGQLTLAINDLFNKYGIRQEVQGEGFDAVYENYYETQVVRLGVTIKL
jgi:outer membrane receptor protein involved in Fe transport